MWLNKIREEFQETHLSNKTYCKRHTVLISTKKAMICCLTTNFFKIKALQDLP